MPYRQFAEWVRDPEALERKAQALEQQIVDDEKRFRNQLERDAKAKGEEYDPSAPLPEMKLTQYEDLRERAAYYRRLKEVFASGRASIVPTLHPYSPTEQLLELEGSPPHRAFSGQPGVPPLGTDFEGKDVFAQLL